MATLATARTRSAPRTIPAPALLTAAAVFAATAVFDVVAGPAGGVHKLHSLSDYVFTGLLIPFALSQLAALVAIRRRASGADGRLGRSGMIASGLALVGLAVDGAVTLLSGDPMTLGPLYPIAMLGSLVGLGLLTAGVSRAGVIPRWAPYAMTAAWLIGGPVGEGGSPIGFRGAALLLASVSAVVAMTLRPARDGS